MIGMIGNEKLTELAALVADEAGEEAADDDPPEDPPAATRAQIWEVRDWVSMIMLVNWTCLLYTIEVLTQGVRGRAATNDTRSGGFGDGSIGITALACVVRDAASSTGDGSVQAGFSARWDLGSQIGNGLSRDSSGQDGDGGNGELHIDGCVVWLTMKIANVLFRW